MVRGCRAFQRLLGGNLNNTTIPTTTTNLEYLQYALINRADGRLLTAQDWKHLVLRNAIASRRWASSCSCTTPAVLRLLERLQSFRVNFESVHVCVYVGGLRVILSPARDSTDSSSKFGGTDIYIGPPPVREKPMKKATIARCTMANELLRRRDQPGHDSTLRPRRNPQQRADHLRVSFQDNVGVLIGAHRSTARGGSDVTPSTKISVQDGNGGEPTDIIGTGPLHYAQPSPGAKSARAAHHDSASIIPSEADCDDTGLPRGRITHQRRPSSPQAQFSPTSEAEQRVLDGRSRRRSLSQSSVQWMPPPDTPGIKFGHPIAKPPGDTFSPNSDRTLFEEPEVLVLDRPQATPGSPDYFSFDGAEGDPSARTEVMPAPVRRVRHSRAPSTEPNFRNPKRASLPLRARTKTNEGLLQLQANPAKPPERPSSKHERRISLGVPIKAAITQAEGLQRSKFGSLIDTPPQTPRTPRTPKARQPEKSGPAASLRQKERDLEYKHRHTFIGTASLDDFLEVLDVSSEHMTTKAAVGKAFLILASSERLLARQASSTAAGWDLVSRTIPDVVNTDYVIQAHVKLGSITLWQFMELIPFDDQEEAPAMSVVEAYSAASHMDSKAGVGATSKAKVFRSWMVQHEEKQARLSGN
ncbi:hypothetical protein EK21DRAFT_79334 [Setomelanomma holmii]|uniref:Uncharacterized protein n=1 Tax=Setomelanomma holmii TaxID=210430 RepID=A0A9P4GZ65_9PLEO|nr:hypothetical protein EK21DRAFT_79334 [Setomelanomma holmii]